MTLILSGSTADGDYSVTQTAQGLELLVEKNGERVRGGLISAYDLTNIMLEMSAGGGGDASAANQLLILTELEKKADLTETQPVSIASAVNVHITDTGGTANTKQLGVQLTASEIGLVTNTIIHGVSTGGGGAYIDVKVNPSGALTTDTSGSAIDTLTGAVTETAPATDTASSGLNGRLQRIAQRITSLIALFPTSLGQKTSANSLSVTVSSDQSAVPVSVATAPALVASSAIIGKVGIDQTTPGTTNAVYLVGRITKTDKSGTITAGGSAQTLMAANSSRLGWQIQNNSAGDLWFNEIGGTAVQSQPSFKLSPGDYYESPVGSVTTAAISIIGATTGQTFTAREW